MRPKRPILFAALLSLVLWTLAAAASAQTIQLVTTTPFSGSGSQVKITATYNSSSPSSGSWYVLYLNKNPTVYGPNYEPGVTAASACDIAYNSGWTQNGSVAGWQLVNDDGATVSYPNSAGIISNSQCIFDVGGSSYSVSGNIVTVTYSVTFKNTWASKLLALWFYGGIGGQCENNPNGPSCTGWLWYGSWTPTARTLSLVSGSATPTSGSAADVKFSVKFDSSVPTEGAWYVFYVGPNSPVNSVANGCDVSYNTWLGGGNPAGWSLVNDAGTAVSYPNSSGIIENNQCTFLTSGSSFVITNNTITMTYHIQLTYAMANQNIGVWVYGAIGGECAVVNLSNACTGWNQVGTWAISDYLNGGKITYSPPGPGNTSLPIIYVGTNPDGTDAFVPNPLTDPTIALPGQIAELEVQVMWISGPQAGQPKVGTKVQWASGAPGYGTGGHAHPAAGAPPLAMDCTPYGGTPTTSLTDSQGISRCDIDGATAIGTFAGSTRKVRLGYSYNPTVTATDTTTVNVTILVPITFKIGGMLTARASAGWNLGSDPLHSGNGYFSPFMSQEVGLLGDAFIKEGAKTGPFHIYRGTLVWGGIYDGGFYPTLLPWKNFYGDDHMWGSSFDVWAAGGLDADAFGKAVMFDTQGFDGAGCTADPQSIFGQPAGSGLLLHVWCGEQPAY